MAREPIYAARAAARPTGAGGRSLATGRRESKAERKERLAAYAASQSGNSRRKENRRKKQLRSVFRVSLVLWGLVLVVVLVGPVMQKIYADKALPGATLGSVPVYGWNKDKLLTFVNQAMEENVINITVDDTTVTATPAELGVRVNAAASIAPLIDHDPWWPLALAHRHGDLQGELDRDVFHSWVANKFPHQITEPINAQLRFDEDSQKYVVDRAVSGVGISRQDEQRLLDSILANPVVTDVTFTTGPIEADITDAEAGATRDYLNARLALDISVTGNGQTYTLTPADIASLATISTTVADTSVASFDEESVVEFLMTSVAPSLDADAVPEVVFAASEGTVLLIEQKGRVGTAFADLETLALAIVTSLRECTNLTLEPTFKEGVLETIVTTYTLPQAVVGDVPQGHWVDVDLPHQRVTLMDGATPVQAFLMSSGAPQHPTPTGIYAVYHKVESQTVAGCVDSDCYSYPDVRWCTWFFDDFGFHTAYWHEDFGKAVSHGCINLREVDAKAVYDWLVEGDKVVIY